MNIPTLARVLLVLACATWPALPSAQTIYRCGNSYSQTPCPGGVAIDVDDSRTAAQKAQTDAAARQTATRALQMERERLALEKPLRAAASGKPKTAQTAKPPAKSTADPGRPTETSKKKKTTGAIPEHFTASVWSDEKKPGKPAEKSPAPAHHKDPGAPARR